MATSAALRTGPMTSDAGRFSSWLRENDSGEPRERLGPTLVPQHLAAGHSLEVPPETLRRWMLVAGPWSRKRQPASREALEGIEPETQFGRRCAKLGRGVIAASPPPAKGRVERHHGRRQDRLIQEMRLPGIAAYEAARRYPGEQYLDEHNAKLSCEAAAGADFQRQPPKRPDRKRVFCLAAGRVVSSNRVVRFENRLLQLKPRRNQVPGAGARVAVQQAREAERQVVREGRAAAFEEIARLRPKPPPEPQQRAAPRRSQPAAKHPWRQPLSAKKRAAAA